MNSTWDTTKRKLRRELNRDPRWQEILYEIRRVKK